MDTDFVWVRRIDEDFFDMNAGLMTVDFRIRPPVKVFLVPVTVSCDWCFLVIVMVIVLVLLTKEEGDSSDFSAIYSCLILFINKSYILQYPCGVLGFWGSSC